MNTFRCEQLDDYLADWLSESQRREFEVHLAGCHECRGRVEQQRRIDRLLAQGMEQLEPVPPSLIDSIETRIHSLRRRRAVRLAWSVSTAVVLALLFGVWSARQQSEPLAERHDESGSVKKDVDRPAGRGSQPESSVRVTLSDPSTAILVPVKTEAPNVSIVWVYPTLKPARLSDKTETN